MDFSIDDLKKFLEAIDPLFTPIAVTYVGYLVSRTMAEQSRKWSENDRLIGKRVDIYEKMAPLLNHIFCYVHDVGDYKETTPQNIVADKRECDRLIHTYQAIWPDDTLASYKDFIEGCFATYQGVGTPAKIRTRKEHKVVAAQNHYGKWEDGWEIFITEECDPEISAKYKVLSLKFARDIQFITPSGKR